MQIFYVPYFASEKAAQLPTVCPFSFCLWFPNIEYKCFNFLGRPRHELKHGLWSTRTRCWKVSYEVLVISYEPSEVLLRKDKSLSVYFGRSVHFTWSVTYIIQNLTYHDTTPFKLFVSSLLMEVVVIFSVSKGTVPRLMVNKAYFVM